MSSLPSVRFLVLPFPGLGIDASVPLAPRLRCVLSAEAYMQGGSELRFGVETPMMPQLRVDLAPRVHVSWRLNVRKARGGVGLCVYDAKGKTGVNGVLEFRHRPNLFKMMLNEKQRSELRALMQEREGKSGGRQERKKERREDRAVMDPRERKDEIKGRNIVIEGKGGRELEKLMLEGGDVLRQKRK